MQRYHHILIVLHWVMALMILLALAAGDLILVNMEPDSPDKVQGLGGHMIVGIAHWRSVACAVHYPHPQHPSAPCYHRQRTDGQDRGHHTFGLLHPHCRHGADRPHDGLWYRPLCHCLWQRCREFAPRICRVSHAGRTRVHRGNALSPVRAEGRDLAPCVGRQAPQLSKRRDGQ